MALKTAWRVLGGLLLAAVLLPVAAYFLLEAWLASAGGREAVERALSERAGTPVRLRGAFDVTLLPEVGVSGTDLGVGVDGEILQARRYAVSLALRPLFHKQLVVDSVSLTGGAVDRARWPQAASGEDANRSRQSGIPQLPEIRHLAIRDFDWREGPGRSYRVEAFVLDDFAPGRDSRFELTVESFGRFAGTLRWNPQGPELVIAAAARGAWPGRIDIDLAAQLPVPAGTLGLEWRPEPGEAGASPDARIAMSWHWSDRGLTMQGLDVDAYGQSLHGAGCLLTGDPPRLDLELSAGRLDLDAFDALPGSGQPASTWTWTPGSEPELPVSLNLVLRADELQRGEVIARGATLRVGAPPDCGLPGPPD